MASSRRLAPVLLVLLAVLALVSTPLLLPRSLPTSGASSEPPDPVEVVSGLRPGAHVLTLAVRGTPASVGKRVRAVVEDPSSGLIAESAPVHLTAWWQTVGVTASISSSTARVGVRRDQADASWAEADTYEVDRRAFGPIVPSRTTRNARQLLVNGTPYAMRGVVYHPSPSGGTPWTLFWNGNPAQCQTDAQLMRAAGINTLRIWYVEATYEAESYRQCMDAFHAAGVGLFWSIQPPTGLNWHVDGDGYLESYWRHVEVALQRLKDHPATLVWEIGSEVNFKKPEGNDWFRQVDVMAARAKRMDPNHLVTTVLSLSEFFGPPGPVHPKLATNIDLWGVNAYGGREGIKEERFRQMVEGDPGRPLWLSEFGVDRYRCVNPSHTGCDAANSGEDAPAQAEWNSHHWQQIAAQLSVDDPGGAVVGAAMFMWADLWWPALGFLGQGTPITHDVTGGSSSWTEYAFPDGHHTAEWFGIAHALPRDAPGPRITSATYDTFLALFTGRPGPALRSPRLAKVTPCTAAFAWETDEQTVPRVDVGEWQRLVTGGTVTAEALLPSVVADGRAAATAHQIEVKGLTPGRTYQAQLRAFDGEGRSTGFPATFSTPSGDC